MQDRKDFPSEKRLWPFFITKGIVVQALHLPPKEWQPISHTKSLHALSPRQPIADTNCWSFQRDNALSLVAHTLTFPFTDECFTAFLFIHGLFRSKKAHFVLFIHTFTWQSQVNAPLIHFIHADSFTPITQILATQMFFLRAKVGKKNPSRDVVEGENFLPKSLVLKNPLG